MLFWTLKPSGASLGRPLEDLGSILISILGRLWGRFGNDFGAMLGSILKSILGRFWNRFWRGFWSQNRPQIAKKWFRNRYRNLCYFHDIVYRFWLHFGAHRPPQNPVFFITFCSWCRSWAILAPRGSPKCSKTTPELDFQGFGTIFERILEHISINSHLNLKSKFPSFFLHLFNLNNRSYMFISV